MLKKVLGFVVAVLFLVNMYGCFALFAGAAAGGGTAFWLSGKLTQEFHASYERTVNASAMALKSLNLKITKESKEAEMTQFRSVYTDGKEIWIDVRKVTESSTKVEVRVGVVKPDQAASDKILKRIQSYL